MSRYTVALKDAFKPLSIFSGSLNEIVFTRTIVNVIELENIHFHHDSAVVLPEPKHDTPDEENEGSSLDVIRRCYLYAKKNSDKELLIAGHTDTSGSDDYNVTLSDLRAKSVLYLLLGDGKNWAAIAEKKHQVEDYQQILAWVVSTFRWDCDPGEVDNIDGPVTKEALKKFKSKFNNTFSGSLDDSEKMFPEIWEAMFHLYLVRLKTILHTDEPGIVKLRKNVHFSSTGPQTVGCGEYHPKSGSANNRNSAIDRRVEFLFFSPNDFPPLLCHPDTKHCVKKSCLLYDPALYDFQPVDDSDISETFFGILAVRLLFHEQPIQGIPVRFFDDSTLLGEAQTDSFGLASLTPVFEIGYYTCQIEGQPDIRIPTTISNSEPVDLTLPFKHPDFDLE